MTRFMSTSIEWDIHELSRKSKFVMIQGEADGATCGGQEEVKAHDEEAVSKVWQSLKQVQVQPVLSVTSTWHNVRWTKSHQGGGSGELFAKILVVKVANQVREVNIESDQMIYSGATIVQ